MAGILPGQGSDAAPGLVLPLPSTPVSQSVISFFSKYDMSLLEEMWSSLDDIPIGERFDALEKRLEEYKMSKTPAVLKDDEDDEDDDLEDDDDDDLEEDEDEEDKDGGISKLMDDEKKPVSDEQLQVRNECEREYKKPRLASFECHGEEA